MFTEANPDKGTETSSQCVGKLLSPLFTEANPDKGTETIFFTKVHNKFYYCLQKLTPIRGRKPIPNFSLTASKNSVYRS